MSTIQSINGMFRIVVKEIKSLEATVSRKALEMTGIKNSPYAKSMTAVITSKLSQSDISDKTSGKLEAMFNAYVIVYANTNNPLEHFVGRHASSKVISYDMKQIRQEIQRAQELAGDCQPMVKQKFLVVLKKMEERLGEMEYSRLENLDSGKVSASEKERMESELGGTAAALSDRPNRKWAPIAKSRHPGVLYSYKRPTPMKVSILPGDIENPGPRMIHHAK